MTLALGVARERFAQFEYGAGVDGEDRASLGQGDAIASPHEQVGVQRPFEQANLAADGGLGNPELAGRSSKAASVTNSDERFELMKLKYQH